MASPSEAEIQTQINQLVWIVHNNELQLRTNTPNFEGEYDEFVSSDAEGDFVSQAIIGLDGLRSIMSSTVAPTTVRGFLDPMIREYGKLKGFPETDPVDILDRLYVAFADGSDLVTSRGFTFASPSADGGNTGDGTLNRLTKDRYGHDIEAATPEAKEFKCIRDTNSGTNLHQELFEIRGADVPRDFVNGVVGLDRVGQITALSADDSQSIIDNPSFNAYEGTAPDITAITSWTETTSINNFQIETSDVYRTVIHEGDAPGSVRFEANDKLTQALTVVRPTLEPLVPYYCQIAFKRENSCDGNLIFRVGGSSITTALVAQSGWTVARIVLDENLFLRNFNQTTLDVEIELASNTTGEVLVDDVIIAPMTLFDGTWYAMVGGATPFLVEDKFTFTDSATESILQKWLWRIYNRYLPHGVATWPEPS